MQLLAGAVDDHHPVLVCTHQSLHVCHYWSKGRVLWLVCCCRCYLTSQQQLDRLNAALVGLVVACFLVRREPGPS
jgi:hypothetical protein